MSEDKACHKRLALFFDGTWNKPQSNTNVWRLYLMCAERSADGREQRKFYDEGVGTRWYYRLAGGLFGFGLAGNVQLGYRWLMEHYDDGDEIYIFGFSRGAFTARALAGLIAKCGLLAPDAAMSFWDVFARYKKGDAKPIYLLHHLENQGKQAEFSTEDRILLRHTRYRPKLVKMVGVWDTVGQLGVPTLSGKRSVTSTVKFYNTNLSTVVENSFQALALDEHRRHYWGMLWTRFAPDVPGPETGKPTHDDMMIEQRWFSGAHCNVGGGYTEDLVAERPLAWLQEMAVDCGLDFRRTVQPTPESERVGLTDSYSSFILGIYRFIFRSYTRWVFSDRIPKTSNETHEPGTVITVNERIDESVFQRCSSDKSYRPPSLIEWTTRKQLDLEAIIHSPAQHAFYGRKIVDRGVESEHAIYVPPSNDRGPG